MRAIVHDRYGPPDVLRLAEVQRPVPKEDEVLVKVRATTVNRTDCGVRSGDTFAVRLGYSLVTTGSPFKALLRPATKILGSEVAGEIVETGPAVTQFQVGDRVFGVNDGKFGANAEFICMRESAPLAHMPSGTSFKQAAAVCDGVILALNCLRRADIRKGTRILIYGASGSIGTAGVQLARYFDAEVTAVCNTKNVDLVRSLGADEVIDYTKEEFTKNGQTYDVIFDAVGKHSFRRCRGSLHPGGVYLPTDGWANVFLALWTKRSDRRVILSIPPRYTKEDVVFTKNLIEAGKYRAIIDRCYPLEEVVAATRYVETEQKTGNVVLVVDGREPGS